MKCVVTVGIFLAISISLCLSAPIAYWRFEENGGIYAYDETGVYAGALYGFIGNPPYPGGGDYNYNGWSTNVPTSTILQTSKENAGSLRFSGGGAGSSIDFSVATPAMTLGPAFTIECYLNFASLAVPTIIFSLGARDESWPKLNFQFGEENGGIVFTLGINRFGYSTGILDGFTFNEWHHIALVKDGTDAYFYLDGLLVSTLPLLDSADDTFTFNPSGPGDRYISSWDGWVDEFRISDEALSPKDFLNYYAAVPEPGTLALLGLGGGLVVFRRRQRNFSSKAGFGQPSDGASFQSCSRA